MNIIKKLDSYLLENKEILLKESAIIVVPKDTPMEQIKELYKFLREEKFSITVQEEFVFKLSRNIDVGLRTHIDVYGGRSVHGYDRLSYYSIHYPEFRKININDLLDKKSKSSGKVKHFDWTIEEGIEKFKLGDRVIVNDKLSKYNNEKGTIVLNDNELYLVAFDNDVFSGHNGLRQKEKVPLQYKKLIRGKNCRYIDGSYLKLINPNIIRSKHVKHFDWTIEEATENLNFRLGDRVECIAKYGSNSRIVNKKGTIILLHGLNEYNKSNVLVAFDENIRGHEGLGNENKIESRFKPLFKGENCWYVPKDFLKLITPKPTRSKAVKHFDWTIEESK